MLYKCTFVPRLFMYWRHPKQQNVSASSKEAKLIFALHIVNIPRMKKNHYTIEKSSDFLQCHSHSKKNIDVGCFSFCQYFLTFFSIYAHKKTRLTSKFFPLKTFRHPLLEILGKVLHQSIFYAMPHTCRYTKTLQFFCHDYLSLHAAYTCGTW